MNLIIALHNQKKSAISIEKYSYIYSQNEKNSESAIRPFFPLFFSQPTYSSPSLARWTTVSFITIRGMTTNVAAPDVITRPPSSASMLSLLPVIVAPNPPYSCVINAPIG
jgi:hypothetical protein